MSKSSHHDQHRFSEVWTAMVLGLLIMVMMSGKIHAVTPRTTILSGIGYGSQSGAPQFLIGAELLAHSRQGSLFTGIQENSIGIHLSDAISFDGKEHVVSTGIEGRLRRSQGPFHLEVEGNYHLRRTDQDWYVSTGIGVVGSTGRVRGTIRFDYVESAAAHFPWFQKDLNGVAPKLDDEPFYRGQVSVSAMVVPSLNLSWSQDARWRRTIGSNQSNLSLTTGPEFIVGEGRLALQGGMIIDSDEMRPIGLVRYDFRPYDSNIEFQINAATDSLERKGPLLYGWLTIINDGADYAVGLRFEESESGSLDPAIYFSIQPKL